MGHFFLLRGWQPCLPPICRNFFFKCLVHTGRLPSDPSQEQSTKVRIPSSMVGRLIGERGKTIAEISRDSKTR